MSRPAPPADHPITSQHAQLSGTALLHHLIDSHGPPVGWPATAINQLMPLHRRLHMQAVEVPPANYLG